VRLTITTDESHGFTGWTGDISSIDRTIVLVMTKSMNLVANIVEVNVNGSWTRRTSGVQKWLSGVVWTGSQLVVVGGGGTILTSKDGITWSKRDSITPNGLNSVAWNGKTLVAVGVKGTIVTSNDGVTWTTQTSATTDILECITWAGNQFIAVGGNRMVGTSELSDVCTIITSQDGITWKHITGGTGHWQAVAWDGSRIIAAGFHYYKMEYPQGSGQVLNYSRGVIYYSTDGASWDAATGTFQDDLGFKAIAYSGTHYVITGHPGGSTLDSITPYLISDNGSSWENYSKRGTEKLNAAVAVGETFVLAGEDGLMYAMSSIGTRTQITTGITEALYGITWTGTLLVAVGQKGTILTSSTN
jgi:hypothetical protein